MVSDGTGRAEELPEAVQKIVATLGLLPHPEGGFYREVFRDATPVMANGPSGSSGGRRRSAVTLIHFLVVGDRPTSWHRVASTEIWHHAGGAPLCLEIEEAEGDPPARRSLLLGDPSALPAPAVGIVPALAWQRARSAGEYSLATCTVAPGFEFEDFQLRST
ncbi:MAG: cupin domain-containing protein [Leptospirillia bacterium]